MELAQRALTDQRTRIALMIAVVAAVALLFALDPVAAWPTTNMPSGGGGAETYWYESSNTDPLFIHG